MWGSRGDTILPRGTPLSHLIFRTPGSCFYRQNTSRREKFIDLVRVPAARRRQSRAVKQGPGSQPGRPRPSRFTKPLSRVAGPGRARRAYCTTCPFYR